MAKSPKTAKSKTKTKSKSPAKPKARAGAKKKVAARAKPKAALSSNPLKLIAQREFAEAMRVLAATQAEAAALTNVAEVFNYATAAWGHQGSPSLPLFQRAFELATEAQWDEDNAESANFHQCLALIAAVLGNRETAREALEKSRQLSGSLTGKEFSGWRYRDVAPSDFRRDLNSLEKMLDDPSVVPAFL